MFFDELSNDEWALLAALVSDEPAVRLNRRGRPRAEPRIVANAVLWILTTGEPWSKLPGRYPSGPTCRRRFEEWQLNGTLLEMVRLLSQTGRTFAYIPQPAPPVGAKPAVKPAPVAAEAPGMRDEGLRGVSWKSPESWQAPGVSSTLSHWRSADPIADITRQLSGVADAAPVTRAPATSSSSAASGTWPAMRTAVPVCGSSEAVAVGAAMERLDAAIASARHPQAPDDQRKPLSMSLAPRGTQIAGPHGYLIYVVAEQVPNAMYRAWAEIMKDGQRVERSGLVGPRFTDAHAAEQYALEWARQWIDRERLTQVAGESIDSARAQSASYAPRQPARPLPKRHVPEPVAVNHGAPLHGPLNAFRGPLRRYPGDAAAATTSPDSNSAADRFPSSYTELISHAG
ncbi:transposase [Paraburkholderia panacisoli]|uniref:Transposase n=1 Tax=Paraburkholderia panacisoli TaxID=2603818 RepID=A0A5B0HAP7_9BURK|nr:transposase [Paraburkholderia panacisoli]KAA1012124.1 transposase [Paraburkholderia panacisoli]